MYSKWNKIDLHIHTDMSRETKSNDYNGNFSVEILLDKLKEHNMKMISLTDHNIINTEAYERIINKDIKVLVGVELDVLISTKQLETYINALIDNSGDKIKHKPFHALVLFRSNNINDLSKKLETMYKDLSEEIFSNNPDLIKEKFYRATTFKYFVKHFKDEDFFIIAHGNKDKGIVNPYKKVEKIEDAQNEILIGGISALEMKSNVKIENTINKYNEGFRRLLRDDFRQSKTTSYVVFSDNHDCSNYQPREFQTWIKGNPSFETLRLAFSDPESRVHTDFNPPRVTSNYIEKIKIKLKEREEQCIELSPHLNVIIGGRSSGKSLFFNTIINLNNEFTPEDKNVFLQNYSELVEVDKTFGKLSIGKFEKTVSIAGEAFCQEAIINLFNNDNDLRNKLKDEFPVVDDEEIKKNEEYLDSLVSSFNKSYTNYYGISNKLDKGDIRQQIEIVLKNSDKVFDINTEELNVLSDLAILGSPKKKLDKFINEIKVIKNLKLNGVKLFTEDEDEIFNDFEKLMRTKKKLIDDTIKKENFKISYKNKLDAIVGDYICKELTQEKQKIEQTKKLMQSNLKDYSDFFKFKLKLKQICSEIENVKIKIPDQKNTKSKYDFVTKVNFDISGDSILTDFFKEKILNYSVESNLYSNVITLANSTKDDIRLKQHTTDGKRPEILYEKFKEFMKNLKSNKTYEIIEKTDTGTEISTLSTSQGKKASIFLDIKLNNYLNSHGNKILLIDQLEDNIDNKYISQELVKIIRKLKRKIQIILVTHNPSIAIYGDAENVIIAENHDNKISYTQGGLEEHSIRDEACRILDGGEVAFKNRMDKYNIDILIKEERDSSVNKT